MKIKDLYEDYGFLLNKDPDFLYHGSILPDLKVLKPHYCSTVKKNVVYATPVKGIAVVMSMHDWTDKELDFGYVEGESLTLTELVPGKIEQVFGDKSKPAYIYQISSKHFKPNPKICDWEMVAYRTIPIIKQEIIDDKIMAMRFSGIRINYFKG
jgi:hypothetical protein